VTWQTLPIQAVPAQTFQATLSEQDCQITIRQLASGVYIDVGIAGSPVISGKRCTDRVSLIRYAYLNFIGYLYFVDTTQQGNDPYYSGLGSRYILVYETDS